MQTAAQRFKDTFSRDVKVHFVGVWCVLRYRAAHDGTWAFSGTLFRQLEYSEGRIFLAPIRQSISATFVMLSHLTNAESNFCPNTPGGE